MKVTDLLLLVFVGPWVVFFLGYALILMFAALAGLVEWATRPPEVRRRSRHGRT